MTIKEETDYMLRKIILNLASAVNRLVYRKVSVKKYLISEPLLSDRSRTANDFHDLNCDFIKSNRDFMVGLHKFEKEHGTNCIQF